VGSQWTKKSPFLFVLPVAKKREECKDRMREIKTLFRPHLQTDAACAVCQLICQHSIFFFLVIKMEKVISVGKPYTATNDIEISCKCCCSIVRLSE
jgi:hypothetical protein